MLFCGGAVRKRVYSALFFVKRFYVTIDILVYVRLALQYLKGEIHLFRLVQSTGDTVPVPQLIFTRLAAAGASEARFRVVLYALTADELSTSKIAAALSLKERDVEKALEYWEGAGLLERVAPSAPADIPVIKETRRRLTSIEVLEAGKNDPTIGILCAELQRIFGGVISQKQMDMYAELYIQDEYPVDLIMMAATHCAGLNKISAAYVGQVLQSWRREGIQDCQSADRYLKLLETRREREQQVAELLRMQTPAFTLTERKRIAEWFEVFHYNIEMIQAARLAAGEKQDEIRYLGAILKKWYAKGYKNLRDVQMGETNHNLRVQAQQVAVAPEEDLLMQAAYVPMRRAGDER